MRRFYWIKEGLLYAAAMLIATVLYTLFMVMMNGSEKTTQEYLSTAIGYLTGLAAILPVIFNMSAYRLTIPLTLSFGATRKETLWGIQLYRIAMLVPVLGAMVLLSVLSSAEKSWVAPVLLLTGCLVSSGIGGLLGALSLKLSGGILTLVTILVMVFGVALATLLVMVVLAVEEEPAVLVYILPAIGALVYGICSCFELRAIKALYVR